MWIWDTSIAVINAHFPAHQGEKKARDEVFQRLISELDLGGHANMESLQSFDHLIWPGDIYKKDYSGHYCVGCEVTNTSVPWLTDI